MPAVGAAWRRPPPLCALSSHAKALAARAAGLGVGVGKLKPSRDQLGRKIQLRALEVERGFGIHQHRHVRAAHQDVALFWLFDEAQFVAQPVATAAADGNAQGLGKRGQAVTWIHKPTTKRKI